MDLAVAAGLGRRGVFAFGDPGPVFAAQTVEPVRVPRARLIAERLGEGLKRHIGFV